ncbi:autotransporter translocation and assembly factor TamB [Chthoniobacter flavus]|uniref:translocation/assembly module TamB domain-containing protein n=1 Tax=Chthoniobacter flavus TaxID=191863 RepID=UPI0010447A7F|nr:translocation/assembly module TamB domain-containing protein [Chthoniobacter flavus]TCO91083.1 autotransporter translocation and assembly factor TamB [Chthoniobacter flavus]
MPEPEKKPSAPKAPKRGWFRRVLRWTGILLLVVIIFHRPLFHVGMRLFLIKLAAKQNLTLDVHFSGSVFTNLIVEGVHAVPTGKGPSPVRKIDIERVRLDYSIPSLIKHGIGEFLRSYEVTNADLDFIASPSKSQPEHEQKMELAQDLNNVLGQPAAYADKVRIQNFNITVRAEKNITEVKGFSLFLDPEAVGYLKIAKLNIPGVPLWENLSAETSYAKRNFFIRHLVLAPDLVLEEVNFDASQRAQNKGSVDLKADLFGGTLHVSLAGNQLNKKGKNLDKSYNTTLQIEAANVGLEAAASYFGAPKPPVAKLALLDVLHTGEPEMPQTWKGHAKLRVEALAAGPMKVDSVELNAQFLNGKAEVSGVNIAAGKNSVALTATVVLPESVNDFPMSEVNASLKINAPDLAALTAMMPEPLQGTISGGGPIKMSKGWVNTDLTLDAKLVSNQKLNLDNTTLRLTANKRLMPAPATPFDDLSAHLVAAVNGVRVQDFSIDSMKLDVEAHNDQITLHGLEVHRAENSVTAQGTYRIPKDLATAATAPIDAKFAIHVPKLEDFGIKVSDQALSGHVQSDGLVKMENNRLNGHVQIDGGDFRLGDFKTGALAGSIQIQDSIAKVEQLTLQLNATDQIAITGQGEARAPFPYEGAVLLDIKDLTALHSLLAVFKMQQPLTGNLHLDWSGKGEPATIKPPYAPKLDHTGQLNFALTKGRFDKIDLSEIKLGGLYGPGFAQTTDLKFVTGPTSFTGSLEMKEGKVRLKDINLAQGTLTVLTGYLFLPIDLDHPQQLIPLDERIAANINAKDLDLEKLLANFGQTSPASGTISTNVVAGGTLSQPLAHLKFQGRKLKAKAVAALDPADLDLDLHFSNNELTLAATAKQPQIQPLTIKGHVPLDLQATIKSKKLDPALPLDVQVNLPPSSLAIVPKLTTQVHRIDGTVGLDVRVAGTVEKPALSGSANIDVKSARFENESIPALGAFKAQLGFNEDTLRFNTFEGELGGGKLKLGGAIKLTKLTEPNFDLHLQADEVLVMRNDSITVRSDADVKLTGPLAAASVSGTVYATHSRFFKEIDILPIALPGRAKPAPKTARSMDTGVSFPQPPLRDWKFDLAIKTKPDDSFLVRGNLANGAAAIDLKLSGTGLAPYLEGSIHVEEFKASLPFSTLKISRGFVYFTKDAPFQPSLDLQADSQTSNYLVHAYIYGKASDPQVTLSSEPPLPYSDIISLLATGVTRDQLSNNADVLASKAAMLAVQELYRKIFLRNKAPAIDRNKQDNGNFMDRFKLEMGAVDNKTGGQQITSRIRITNAFYLIGDLVTDEGFTGRLKYLIRFR